MPMFVALVRRLFRTPAHAFRAPRVLRAILMLAAFGLAVPTPSADAARSCITDNPFHHQVGASGTTHYYGVQAEIEYLPDQPVICSGVDAQGGLATFSVAWAQLRGSGAGDGLALVGYGKFRQFNGIPDGVRYFSQWYKGDVNAPNEVRSEYYGRCFA